jgi:hypothetical protein
MIPLVPSLNPDSVDIRPEARLTIGRLHNFRTPSHHYQTFRGGLCILTLWASARTHTEKAGQISSKALGCAALGILCDLSITNWIAFDSCLYNAAIRRDELLDF